ncbi:MAG: hypothetical protein KME30_05320 [Iphinoe sp. HA4291-MV1]|jgi:hypothetical protein|nr:hypothetical protein [Iphinoe sp. HA4291-MV1]
MKFKLVQLLTVCIVTFMLLSPGLMIFSIVWERHIELIQTKDLACEPSQNCTDKVGVAPKEEIKSSQDRSNVEFSATNFVDQSLKTKPDQFVKILQWFFLLFPIILGILILLYDRYLIYRATVFQQQVEMLEKLWRQGIEQ